MIVCSNLKHILFEVWFENRQVTEVFVAAMNCVESCCGIHCLYSAISDPPCLDHDYFRCLNKPKTLQYRLGLSLAI